MFWWHIIIFLLAVAIYSNSLSGDFVHDDIAAVVRNPDVNWKQTSKFASTSGESRSLWFMWKNDYWGASMSSSTSHKSYRPLTVLTFRLNYWQWGDSLCRKIFHRTNVLIHGIVLVLTLYLCQHVLQLKLTTSLLASGLFTVHPIHAEAVAGITGRADALAYLLMLTSFLLYHRCMKISAKPDEISDSQNYNMVSKTLYVSLPNKCFQDKNHNECTKLNTISESDSAYKSAKTTYVRKTVEVSSSSLVKAFALLMASGIFGFAAMLAKETGITILGINLLYDFYLQCSHKKAFNILINQYLSESRFKPRVSSFRRRLLVQSVLLMNDTFPHFGRSDNPAAYSDSIRTRLLTFLYLPVFSAWLIFCPSTLSYDWQLGSMPLIESFTDFGNVFTILFYGNLLTLAGKSVLAGKETGRVLTLSFVFITLPFLPACNLFFHVGFVVAERVLYTPSLGVCIVVAFCVERLGNWFTPGFGQNMPAFTTISEHYSWTMDNPAAAEYKFLQAINMANQAHGGAHFSLGVLYMNYEKFSEAASHFKMLPIIDPLHHRAFHYLNVCLSALNNQTYQRGPQQLEIDRQRNVPPKDNAITLSSNQIGNLSVQELYPEIAIKKNHVRKLPVSSSETFTNNNSIVLKMKYSDLYQASKQTNLNCRPEHMSVCRKLLSMWEVLKWPAKM